MIATRISRILNPNLPGFPFFGLVVPDGEDISSEIDQAEVTPCSFKYWATLSAL